MHLKNKAHRIQKILTNQFEFNVEMILKPRARTLYASVRSVDSSPPFVAIQRANSMPNTRFLHRGFTSNWTSPWAECDTLLKTVNREIDFRIGAIAKKMSWFTVSRYDIKVKQHYGGTEAGWVKWEIGWEPDWMSMQSGEDFNLATQRKNICSILCFFVCSLHVFLHVCLFALYRPDDCPYPFNPAKPNPLYIHFGVGVWNALSLPNF